jgi:hypothetical protein
LLGCVQDNQIVTIPNGVNLQSVAIKPSLEGDGKKIVIQPPDGQYKNDTTYLLVMNQKITYTDGT